MKIDLSKKILTVKGQEIKINSEKKDPKNPKMFIKKATTIRDYLLMVLSQKFETKNRKETFWTMDLGIKIADEKNKEVEISKDKLDFLARVVENNKYKRATPGGETEVELFFPFELGQLLMALGKGEEE